MKTHIISITLLLLSVMTAQADTFTINGRSIIVPAPHGFVRVTDEMTAVQKIVRQMTDPMNDTLAYYISEADVPTAMSGELPLLGKTFILKVNKQLRNMTVGKDEFSRFIAMTTSQNKQLLAEVKARIPDHMNRISQGVSREFDIKFAMELSQMVPLDPHYESENAFSYSTFINYGVTAGDKRQEAIVAATSTFLNASGVVLFLYAYGSKEDLEWTRTASRSWAERVMEENSPPPEESPRSGGIDWDKVMEKGLIGAILGALFALIMGGLWRFKKKKG